MTKKTLPNVYIYNPTCEIAIANGTLSFVPNKTLSKFESDLDLLPLYFTNEEDVLLVKQLPDQQFLNLLHETGIKIPQFKLLESAIQDKEFVNQPKNALHPWGWSPRIHHLLKPFKSSCSKAFLNQPNAYWQDNHRELYGRKTSLSVLKEFLQKADSGKYVDPGLTAKICTKIDEIQSLINEWKQIVIKAPLSSSGRGLQVLRQSCLNDSIIQWINGTLASQGYVMVEALLNKKHDFSLQYYCDGKGSLNYLGSGFFETNTNGQYDGNILGGIPDYLKNELPVQQMKDLSSKIGKAISNSKISNNYTGYLGVDCMVLEDKNGEKKIHPCVEINLRYNMGTLALTLDKYLHPESEGAFKLTFKPGLSFNEFHEEMVKKHPFKMKNGLWHQGYLPLVSPFQNKKFGAYILLNRKTQK